MSKRIEGQDGYGSDLSQVTRLDPNRYRRLLPEFEDPRGKAYGIAFGPDSMNGTSTAFWVEKVPDGYEVSLSVLDVASGQIKRFEKVGESLKAITFTTTLDRELQSTGFSLGLTNCHLLAIIRDTYMQRIVEDENSDLYPLATSYLEIATRLQEERELDGAVDSVYAFAKRIIKGEEIPAGEIIKREFLHLVKRSIAAKLDHDGGVVLYENWPESDDGVDMPTIQALGKQLRRQPTPATAEQLLKLLRVSTGKRFVSLKSSGHVLQNRGAHFKFMTPGHDLESFVNATILHGIIIGENPYTPEELQVLADYLNTGKKVMSPIKKDLLGRTRDIEKIKRGNYMPVVRERVRKLGLDGLSIEQIPHSPNNPFKVRLEVNTPNGREIIIGSGASYDEARDNASEKMYIALQWLS